MSYYVPKTTKLQQTITKIVDLLLTSNFHAGDILPTVRELADQMGVSIYTVHNAINELKKNEIIGQTPNKKHHFIIKLPEYSEHGPGEAPVSDSIIKIYTLIGSYKNIRKINSTLMRQKFNRVFEEKNPNIQIEEIQFDPVRWKAEEQQLGMLLSGDRPSGGEISQCSLPLYHEMGLISSVECPETAEYLEKIPAEILELCRLDGRIMMYPLSWNISFLIYNKALFRKAGLAPEQVSYSLENFTDALLRLKSIMNTGMPLRFYNSQDLLVLVLFWFIQQQKGITVNSRANEVDWSDCKSLDRLLTPLLSLWREKKAIDLGPNHIQQSLFDLTCNNVALTLDNGQIAWRLLFNGAGADFGILPLPDIVKGSEIFTISNILGVFVNAKTAPVVRRSYLKYMIEYRHFIAELSPAERYHAGFSLGLQSCEKSFPPDWVRTFRLLRSHSVWEPIRSNWNKFFLKDVVDYINSGAVQTKNLTEYSRMLSDYYRNEMPNDFIALQ